MNAPLIGQGYARPGADAYTVLQFCAAHGGMSRSAFYQLIKENRGPRTFKIGRRTFIGAEAAAEWRRRMEAETAGEVSA